MSDPLSKAPKRFVFAMLPKYSAMSFVNALETLRIANRELGHQVFDWVICSETAETVLSALGSGFPVDQGLEDCTREDIIVVCGGEDIKDACTPAILNWLRRNDRRGVPIVGLNTGAYVLARAGLLDGQSATIHWENRSSFVEEFPEVELTEWTYTVQGKHYSTAGGTASIDLMLHFIADLQNEELATTVADQLNYTNIRTMQEWARVRVADRVGFRHPKLSEILALMETNLEEPLRPADLAATVNISTRQLERLFRRYLRSTPKKYYTEMRLQRAQHLLLQTDMSIINVALACGFNTSSHFSRKFRERYGMSPHKLRGDAEKD